MLDVKEIVDDVMSFPGCRVAVYVPDNRNTLKSYVDEVFKAIFANEDCLSLSAGWNCVIKTPSKGEVVFNRISDHKKMAGRSVYSSHYDSEVAIPIGQYEYIMSEIKARETQQKPKENMEPILNTAMTNPEYEIKQLVRDNPEIFLAPEGGATEMQIALNKLTELVETEKPMKEELPTFEGYPLVAGMVFKNKEDGLRYTLHKLFEQEYILLDDDNRRYCRSVPDIVDVFDGDNEGFILISVPVEDGYTYEIGQRFIYNSNGTKYILSFLGDNNYALIDLYEGNRYQSPGPIEHVFDGEEKKFSLLIK